MTENKNTEKCIDDTKKLSELFSTLPPLERAIVIGFAKGVKARSDIDEVYKAAGQKGE